MYGQRIRQLRKEMKWTGKQLGEKLNLAESTISGYENETRKPDIGLLDRMANLFNVSVDYLTGRTDSRDRDFANGLINAAERKKQTAEFKEQSAHYETNVGRAFFGGADKYTEEEIEVARAAAKAAIEAMRKARKKTD